jgi:hypothetical protein
VVNVLVRTDDTVSYDCPRTLLPLVRVPESYEEVLALQVGHTWTRAKLNTTWLTFVPSRVGRSAAVDAATSTIVKTIENTARGMPTDVSRTASMPTYMKAVSALRTLLSGDLTERETLDYALLTVGILKLHDWILQPAGEQKLHAHVRGLSAILLATPKTKPLSEGPS